MIFIAILILSFLLSTFFSVIKIIFNSTDKNSFPIDNEKLRYLASKIEDIQENKTVLATTVSFGKTFSNTTFAVIAFCLISQQFPEMSLLTSVILTILFSVVILSIFAYAIPRALSLYYHQRVMTVSYYLYGFLKMLFMLFSASMRWLHSIILKILRFDEKLAFLSDEEKLRLSENGNSEEALDKDEKKMIRQIFELGETTVKEIMLPRIDIKALDIDTDYQTALSTIREAGHSRIPVYKDTIDSIIGILYAKDILSWLSKNPDGKWDLEKLLKKPQFVPTNKKIDDLMRDLKRDHVHIAIVVDEYGGTAGIVTMEDILEEIVGEIQDEYDSEEEPVVKIEEDIYHVKPHIELDDLAEKINIHLDFEDEEYNTLGGLFYHEYGEVPEENTEFEFNGLRLKVIKMNNQRIEKLELEIIRGKDHPVDLEKEF